jgi:hypothetical protein
MRPGSGAAVARGDIECILTGSPGSTHSDGALDVPTAEKQPLMTYASVNVTHRAARPRVASVLAIVRIADFPGGIRLFGRSDSARVDIRFLRIIDQRIGTR